jgi:hypothetical protein
MGVVIVKFAHAIARVLERLEVWARSGATFGAGVTALYVASLPAARSRAPTALCRGGCDCWGSWPPKTSHRASAAFTMDEAEPDVRFLLSVGTKLDLSSCCCCNRGGQIVMRHV